jgi:multidrug efflux pump subunit AcrA (membrane-fusion protein)
VVTAVLADAGQVVAAGQPVLRIARPEEKEVAIAIPESRLAEIRAARKSPSACGPPRHAAARRAARTGAGRRPGTRTYAARIRLLSPPPRFASA